ncbi:Macrolide export ATP-binding/permease protein MacB [Raoultella terrigena]|uniref:Macrolide export ATP-binding/permease protein MacB n=1 Tax=Raoultella terrigena TaxID=577 RepID=A0A4U9D999_RAOTE|nr:Macrolide export ATP-binding/permease protein MacB [Raoultella terrigena]
MLQQFLIEAVLVCLVGGALGVTLSLMIAFVLQLFLPGWEIGFSPLALLTAFLCSTLTGVLFGWLPREMPHALIRWTRWLASSAKKMPVRRTGIYWRDVHNEAKELCSRFRFYRNNHAGVITFRSLVNIKLNGLSGF